MFNRLAHKRQLRRRPTTQVAATVTPKPTHELSPTAEDFVIESLEPRLLMAAVTYDSGTRALTVAMANNDQALVFSGTAAALNFTVDGVADGGSQNIVLGVPTLYNVSSITVTLGTGGDFVQFPGSFNIAANITGGSGADTYVCIWGGGR
jgi:hypothetical protein